MWKLAHMPELQPHVAFDSEQWILHTTRICRTDILSMGESSDEFGPSMAIVVIAEYTGKNVVPETCFNKALFCYFRVLGFRIGEDVYSRLW